MITLMKHFSVTFLSLIMLCAGVHGQTLAITSSSTYYHVERSNWSRYVNGKYIGLTHRETRANVSCKGNDSMGVRFSGFFYVLEETLKDMTKSAQSVDEIVSADFTVSSDGHTTFAKDSGFPQYRDFPVFPSTTLQPGDKWQAEGKRAIDPKNDGKRTVLTIEVEYTFIGAESYKGEDVYRLKAKFATRLNKYLKLKTDDQSLESATGTHDVDMLVSAETGAVLLILDRLDETFGYTDGSTLRFKGNTAIFTEYPAARDRKTLLANIKSVSDSVTAPVRDTRPSVEDSFALSPGEPKAPGGALATGTPPAGQAKPDASLAPSAPIEQPAPIAPSANTAPPAPLALDAGQPFAVEETEQGVRLSVRDLRFEPDSDTILAGETWRLDAIVKTLLLAKGGNFLVEGHTASVGKPSGEKELSILRAKKVINELVARGLSADQFIFSGYGGTKPLADNTTVSGRALNRRVEITILE